MTERLQKILARAGFGSRREVERWIAEGRVMVNQRPARVGSTYVPGDRIAIDGKDVTVRLRREVSPQGFMVHKLHGQPIEAGVERARAAADAAPHEPKPVLDQLPKIRGSRWVPINPMHPGDSGLLLFTNDGHLSYALTRRKRRIPCTYLVRVRVPRLEPPVIEPRIRLETGQGVEDIEFTHVELVGGEGANLWYRVQAPRADHRAAVRALFESRNLKVSRLMQVTFGDLELPRDLPRGRQRALTPTQLVQLYGLAQIEPPPSLVRPPRVRADRRRARKQKTAPCQVRE